jgi:hypothetical protein
MDLINQDIFKITELINLSNNSVLDTSSKISILNQCSRVVDDHITHCMDLQHTINLEIRNLCNHSEEYLETSIATKESDNTNKSKKKITKKINVVDFP